MCAHQNRFGGSDRRAGDAARSGGPWGWRQVVVAPHCNQGPRIAANRSRPESVSRLLVTVGVGGRVGALFSQQSLVDQGAPDVADNVGARNLQVARQLAENGEPRRKRPRAGSTGSIARPTISRGARNRLAVEAIVTGRGNSWFN